MDLKTAYEPYFRIGVAISPLNLQNPAHCRLVQAEFNSFTCENDMKPMYFLDEKENLAHPEKYDTAPALSFRTATPYLEFAKKSGIAMRGHTLLWHHQTPVWFFHEGYDADKPLASRETMLARMENYIHGVLDFVQTGYPGIIYAWDVVNEAVGDDHQYRKSLWYDILGSDFITSAFTFARKYADPSVALFYNDYETSQEEKCNFIIHNILKPLMAEKLIDGMGLQSHLLMDHPDPERYRAALEQYGALGLQIHVTELDMHNADPSPESMHWLAERYQQFFRIYLDAKISGKANITSVTFWNLRDEDSWLTGFRKETSYPLLFQGDCKPKEAYEAVLRLGAEAR